MDANREMELAELKESIKKAEARRDMLFADKDRAWEKVQDEIIILQRRLEEKEKLGESNPPAPAANFLLPCMNLPKKSSLETIRRVPCILI